MRRVLLIMVGILLLSLAWYLEGDSKLSTKASVDVFYECKNNKTINAVISEKFPHKDVSSGEIPIPNGQVHVELSDGRILDLDQTISASGVRYANTDESFVFWSKGNGALILENNKEKSFIRCILVKDKPQGSNLNQVYANSDFGFSLRHSGYGVDEKYIYNINPNKQIHGVKFLIPNYLRQGTNLSSDTYISVEKIPQEFDCKAGLFLDGNPVSKDIVENQISYSMASSSGAGAGNRYEEIVYALSGTNSCVGIRYFIHYGVIQNYDPGTVKEFNMSSIIKEFDLIRSTVVFAD